MRLQVEGTKSIQYHEEEYKISFDNVKTGRIWEKGKKYIYIYFGNFQLCRIK